jgi:hypothetical protein
MLGSGDENSSGEEDNPLDVDFNGLDQLAGVAAAQGGQEQGGAQEQLGEAAGSRRKRRQLSHPDYVDGDDFVMDDADLARVAQVRHQSAAAGGGRGGQRSGGGGGGKRNHKMRFCI